MDEKESCRNDLGELVVMVKSNILPMLLNDDLNCYVHEGSPGEEVALVKEMQERTE